jgi:type II secretory pathway pseudopilin PulG
MTLAELVVVLLIMAILASVAVESLAPKVDQARYDATLESLSQIRTAIVATENTETGAAVTGFVADNGRWPTSLAELTLTPAQVLAAHHASAIDLLPFAVQPAPAPHNDVLLPVGHRGPYLNLPPDRVALLDGWDKPFAVVATPSGGLRIASLASLRPQTSAGYGTDLFVDIEPTAVQAAMVAGKVVVTGDAPPSQAVNVLLFTPAPASVSATGVRTNVFSIAPTSFAPIEAPNSSEEPTPGALSSYETSFQIASGLTDSLGATVVLLAGPAALRVATADNTTKSSPTHLTLSPGSSQVVNFHLTLPATPPPMAPP